jgi:cytoskeletal protein RodZ
MIRLFHTEDTSIPDGEQSQGCSGSNGLSSSPPTAQNGSSGPLTLSQITPRTGATSEASKLTVSRRPSPTRAAGKRSASAMTDDPRLTQRKPETSATAAQHTSSEHLKTGERDVHIIGGTEKNAVLQTSIQKNDVATGSKKPTFHEKTKSISRQAKGKGKEDMILSSSAGSFANVKVSRRKIHHQGTLHSGGVINPEKLVGVKHVP